MTKAALKAKEKLKANPLYFIGLGFTCVCEKCGGKPGNKKAPFYIVWSELLTCSKCGTRYG